MKFSEYQSKSEKKYSSVRGKRKKSPHDLKRDAERTKRRNENMNPHINYEREHEKGNSRKDPTKVICITCKKEFVLPFKPRRPEVYCDTCFRKKGKKGRKEEYKRQKLEREAKRIPKKIDRPEHPR